MIYNNVKNVAKDLLKSESICCGELNCIIAGFDDEDTQLLKTALLEIINRRFDMKDFFIDDNPQKGWYSFYDGKDRYFEVIVHNNKATIAYPEPICENTTASKEIEVDTIEKAINGSSAWLKNCKLAG